MVDKTDKKDKNEWDDVESKNVLTILKNELSNYFIISILAVTILYIVPPTSDNDVYMYPIYIIIFTVQLYIIHQLIRCLIKIGLF